MAFLGMKKRRKRRVKKRRHPVRPQAEKAIKKKVVKPVAKPPTKPVTQPVTKPATSTPTTTSSVNPQTWVSPLAVATVRERLVLNRFGTGFTQTALARLRAAGSPEAWLAQQLDPAGVSQTSKAVSVDSWFSPLLNNSPAQKYATDQAGTKSAWTYSTELGNWTMLRRIYSERALLERVTDFWSNHFNVSVSHDRAWPFRADYDATIRANALGSFEDLLIACSLHPAMRMYLDNYKSVRNAPNENQGRELLELHTVGLGAGYTEAMVKDSAKILSGYTVDYGASMTVRYDSNKHTMGAVSVLGFSHANTAADGQAVTIAYLKYLANHPATARRIARRMAVYFVSDDPSDALVDHLAGVYTASGTSIKAVLTAISAHAQFLGSEGSKVRTPYDDLVATARVLDVQATAPSSGNSFANAIAYTHGAIRLYSWMRPDGAPITNSMWSTASRVFNSYGMHQNTAGGYWPKEAVTYRTPASWLPASQVRFDRYVDHLCRLWLGKAADARLLNAARQAVTRPESWGVVTNTTLVDSKHAVASWSFPRLASALLDSPDHMTT